MFKARLNLRNVATVVACLAVCVVMSCDDKKDKDDDGKKPPVVTGGADITFSLKAGANENEVIVACNPAMPKLFRDTGFGPAYFIVALGNPFDMTQTGGTGDNNNVYTNINNNYWNTAGTEFTFIFDMLNTETWEGNVKLKPINPEFVTAAAALGVKSVTIGTNDPVTIKVP